MDNSKTLWLPEKASTFADIVDPAFNLFYWISVFFSVLIFGLMVAFTIKYIRKRPDQLAAAQVTHNLPLELSWTIIPLIIVFILFFIGMKGYLHMRVPPADNILVNVTGMKWKWIFNYPTPDGVDIVNDTLVVPVNSPVKLVMTSKDVLHSFFIPAFRTKADVVPNRYHSLWFQATKEGVFPVQCTQYCGTNHSYMLTAVKVVSPDVYEEWRAKAANPSQGKTPAEYGAVLYKKFACVGCHSLDGSKLSGPSWKGLWGKTESLANGSQVQVDAAYVRESILQPAAKVVAGFQPVMPPYQGQLSDKDVEAIIAYLQTLK